MITISHDHENGTLVHGTSKGDGVYELIGPRTAARFRYFPSIRQIGIPQSRDQLAKRWQIDQAAKALRDAGFEVEVTIDDTPRGASDVRADRADRLDNRRDRLEASAERHMGEAERHSAAADHYAERFSGGQPILVGHHSERSARTAQKRMHGHDEAANREHGTARYQARAASVVGREAARRETPPVIRRRIDRLEAELRQVTHRINGTRPANDWRGAYYSPEAKPASGERLEQCQVRKAFIEHQLEGDRALLAEHVAGGYVMHSRETIHKGDRVMFAAPWQGRPGEWATVTRVNPKSVSLDRDRWPTKLDYERIHGVECPHEGTVTEAKPATSAPAVQAGSGIAARLAGIKAREALPEPVRVDPSTGAFFSPAPVVERILDAAGDLSGLAVLEPSAGAGNIACAADQAGADVVDCVELVPQLAEKITRAGYARKVTAGDFLAIEPSPEYDRVLMNPPFRRGQDIEHVRHALKFVRPGGLLVAVMPSGPRSRKFAESAGASITDLPYGSFIPSGTNVSTFIAVIQAEPATEPEPGCLF